MIMSRSTLEAASRAALAERDGKLHSDLDGYVAGPDDARIAVMGAAELRDAMRAGNLTCVRACRVFCHRSHVIGLKELNCVTEELYAEALAEAARLDASGKLTAADSGDLPLLGVPISIKDSIIQAGTRATCGMACRAEAFDEEDGVLVELVRAAGGIPFVRSNVPQCLMMPETDNRVYGRSKSPWNPERVVGGSSGGEGGLISSRCSPLGLGSDIGGSLRIPAFFCGVFTLKPTPERITRMGLAHPLEAPQPNIKVVAGPMANSSADLGLLMEALLAPLARQRDKYIPPGPWDIVRAREGPGRKLRVGVFTTDGWFDPCAACKRAVHETAAVLEAAGHHTEPFELPVDGWEVARLYYGQGEPLMPLYDTVKNITDLPNWARPPLTALLKMRGEKRRASLFALVKDGGVGAAAYWKLTTAQAQMCEAFTSAMAAQRLDVILYPMSLPAWQHGRSADLTPALTYTFLGNLLGWPVGVVPVSRVREDEQSYPFEALPGPQRDSLAAKAAAAMEGSAGLPVGVQLMAPPFEDELVLYAMRQVEALCPFKDVPPASGL